MRTTVLARVWGCGRWFTFWLLPPFPHSLSFRRPPAAPVIWLPPMTDLAMRLVLLTPFCFDLAESSHCALITCLGTSGLLPGMTSADRHAGH
ncbi:hypothetical protein CHC_T00008832001 [Chondrus crispus]|uniref:Uncharacterized protein n=1 Tax=Chondrus crispus TaxID=2769 RepID=R7QS76_CHOCR|nr:hypothetical protein CHC_T00008832001 [Chondrus crispus]CDF40578.1 hypothetical protein CHC_T00008832001 [Chondrus crispus]|eukprot:XP_005710872.1 hypothetical protein CHC_T00008832001 [Chondrus crispus]